jgi:peptidoglycan/xylan/chitin deacetylase (PgdA/CDA1 family)
MINFRTSTLLFFLFLLAFNLGSVFLCPAAGGIAGFFCRNQQAFYITLISVYLATGFIFAFFPCSRFHYRDVYCKGDGSTGKIALTFDDGPDPVQTPVILDILKKHEVKAAFFLIGKRIKGNEEIVRRMFSEGHEIGNHSYSHSWYWDFLPGFVMKKELRRTAEIILEITGKKPRLFRPPYGVINPMVSNALKRSGLKVIAWNRRSLDTVIRDQEKVTDRVTRNLQPGDVVLLHDTAAITRRVLDTVIARVKEKGLGFGSLEEILKTRSYE